MKPVCLVIGAGAGIGGTVGKRFAKEGYHAVLCRRSNEEGLNKLVAEIQDDGGEATGFLLNAVKEDTIEERVKQVEAEIGPIEVIIFNLGAQVGNRSLEETTYKIFELGWRMATFALFMALMASLANCSSFSSDKPGAWAARARNWYSLCHTWPSPGSKAT